MSHDDLPEPLIPSDVDLRDFRFMPLDISLLANSDTWGMADGWQAKALINLWCRAWHQVPAGSLPDNDVLLAAWSGVQGFDAMRDFVLRGFVKCSDGRLYHPVICEKALDAWEGRTKRSEAGKAGAKSRWGKKKRGSSKRIAKAMRQTAENAHAMDAKGQGEGQGQGEYLSPSSRGAAVDQSVVQAIDVGQNMALVTWWYERLEHHWPNEAEPRRWSQPRGVEDAMATFQRQGAPPELIREHLDAAMQAKAMAGETPPTNPRFVWRSMTDRIAQYLNGDTDARQQRDRPSPGRANRDRSRAAALQTLSDG